MTGGGRSFIPERKLDGAFHPPRQAPAPGKLAFVLVPRPLLWAAQPVTVPTARQPTAGLSWISLNRQLSTDRCKPNDDQLWPAALERAHRPLAADFRR